MNTVVLEIILGWVSYFTPYGTAPLPLVQYVPKSFFEVNVCGGNVEQCQFVEGWYNDGGVLYILETLEPETIEHDSVVFHELVHYLQFIYNPDMTSCDRERQAYAAQDMYLIYARSTRPERMTIVC
jgi:hypothetical protein